MKKVIFYIIAIALILLSSNVFATDLRGLIQGYDNITEAYYPLANIQVKLMHWNGNKWQVINTVFTNSEGFYYFSDVEQGTYYISVIDKYYKIKVIKTDYQDIGKITI